MIAQAQFQLQISVWRLKLHRNLCTHREYNQSHTHRPPENLWMIPSYHQLLRYGI